MSVLYGLLDLILFIEGMKDPVELSSEAELVRVDKLSAKVSERIVISLVNSQRLTQKHDIVNGLQLGHIT